MQQTFWDKGKRGLITTFFKLSPRKECSREDRKGNNRWKFFSQIKDSRSTVNPQKGFFFNGCKSQLRYYIVCTCTHTGLVYTLSHTHIEMNFFKRDLPHSISKVFENLCPHIGPHPTNRCLQKEALFMSCKTWK